MVSSHASLHVLFAKRVINNMFFNNIFRYWYHMIWNTRFEHGFIERFNVPFFYYGFLGIDEFSPRRGVCPAVFFAFFWILHVMHNCKCTGGTLPTLEHPCRGHPGTCGSNHFCATIACPSFVPRGIYFLPFVSQLGQAFVYCSSRLSSEVEVHQAFFHPRSESDHWMGLNCFLFGLLFLHVPFGAFVRRFWPYCESQKL